MLKAFSITAGNNSNMQMAAKTDDCLSKSSKIAPAMDGLVEPFAHLSIRGSVKRKANDELGPAELKKRKIDDKPLEVIEEPKPRKIRLCRMIPSDMEDASKDRYYKDNDMVLLRVGHILVWKKKSKKEQPWRVKISTTGYQSLCSNQILASAVFR